MIKCRGYAGEGWRHDQMQRLCGGGVALLSNASPLHPLCVPGRQPQLPSIATNPPLHVPCYGGVRMICRAVSGGFTSRSWAGDGSRSTLPLVVMYSSSTRYSGNTSAGSKTNQRRCLLSCPTTAAQGIAKAASSLDSASVDWAEP